MPVEVVQEDLELATDLVAEIQRQNPLLRYFQILFTQSQWELVVRVLLLKHRVGAAVQTAFLVLLLVWAGEEAEVIQTIAV